MREPDSRLSLCASFVRQGARLADIGTDHAYLPVWLCRNGVCPSAVAADINPDPLSRGQLTVEEAGLSDRITTRLSDGLSDRQSHTPGRSRAYVVLIRDAENVKRILEACKMIDRDGEIGENYSTVRTYILRQDCCVASDKCYTVILAAYTGENKTRSELYPYLGELCPRTNATHLRFVNAHIGRLRKQSRGDARFAVLADGLQKATGE